MSKTVRQMAAAALAAGAVYATPVDAQSAAALAVTTVAIAAKQNQNSKDS